MGRREFFAWVDQAAAEKRGGREADDPHSWAGTDEDPWGQQAREKRRQARGW